MVLLLLPFGTLPLNLLPPASMPAESKIWKVWPETKSSPEDHI